jgi:hypothetical protein
VNLWKTTINGQELYDTAKGNVGMAIKEYEQAVMHLTACIVAGKVAALYYLMSENRYRQTMSENEKQDKEFMDWLSPSYWLVESQLYGVRQKRSEGTLHWSHALEEFQAWRLADLTESSKDRILWLYGTLGIGKSTIAGYLIDLLKCRYPNAIVAYFFCRSHQTGLTKALDIIRTLSYQCIDDDQGARCSLEGLKKRDFRISDDLEIGLLFEKLLREPLLSSKKEIYIVLDGLDEADSSEAEQKKLLELLVCLTRLPYCRLLFISRPSPDISKFIPNMTKRRIGKIENDSDILVHVEKCFAESQSLRKLFGLANVDPKDYFKEKANGIFLWVDLVMQQLAKVKSASVFQKCLEGFSEASGSMEKLYTNILSKVEEDDRPWIREIIRWVTLSVETISINELQHAVEFTLRDSLVDFLSFLEVECGSMLQSSGTFRRTGVQLIHETFRTFVITRAKCPSWVFIDGEISHGSIVLNCLGRLNKSDSHIFDEYCVRNWATHLLESTALEQREKILKSLYELFTFRLNGWVRYRYLCCSVPIPCANYEILAADTEEPCLNATSQWIQKGYQDGKEAHASIADAEKDSMLGNWLRAVLHNPSILGEAIGKAAVNLWLDEKSSAPYSITTYFALGLNYYWKRENRYLNNWKELAELVQGNFQNIAIWAGSKSYSVIDRVNSGIVCFVLQQWEDCVRFLAGIEVGRSGLTARICLSLAYMFLGNYNAAVETVCKLLLEERLTAPVPMFYSRQKGAPLEIQDILLTVLSSNGNYKEIIKLCDQAARVGEHPKDTQKPCLPRICIRLY